MWIGFGVTTRKHSVVVEADNSTDVSARWSDISISKSLQQDLVEIAPMPGRPV